ncbi:fungal-specific transcription factor domain-containing protein [Xylogone sp. PMI_703]|nr:fungal-specific transcription factor domain-containing protein [Xylogone sp. PMI_703]
MEAPSQHDHSCNHCRTKKIKCDRRLPRCRNCRRSSLDCSYTEVTKRVNQTNVVLSSLDAIQTRLSAIEGVLSTVSATVARPAQLSGNRLANCLDHIGSSQYEFDREGFALPGPSVSTQPQVPFTCDWKEISTLHASSLLISSGFEAYLALTRSLTLNFHPNTSTEAELKEQFSKYQEALYRDLLFLLSSSRSIDLSEDSQLIGLVPRALIEDAYDTFFTELNPALPLFDKKSFRHLITNTYAASTEVKDPASVICINNVVLMTLNAKCKFRSANSSTDPLDMGLLDIRILLLRSAKKALGLAKDLMAPRLINVQALLSLSIIAHENLQLDVAEIMLDQACQVARMMGLHRKYQIPTSLTRAEAEEQKKVFWLLFIIDKHISFLVANSCRLPSYDCNVSFPEDEHFQRFLVPRIQLARIQEQIYIDLYSALAQGRSVMDCQRRMLKLRKSLDYWHQMHESSLSEAPFQESDPDANLRLALNFNYYNTRIMACQQSLDETLIKLRLEDARMGIRLMFRARMLSRTLSGSQLLRGLLHYHPFVEFFEIYKDLVTHPSNGPLFAEDLALLRGVIEIIQDLSDHSHLSSSYSSQILLVASTHFEIAKKFVEFVDANKNDVAFASSTRTSGGNLSHLSNESLRRNQYILQQFSTGAYEGGNNTLSSNNNDKAMSDVGAMTLTQSRTDLHEMHVDSHTPTAAPLGADLTPSGFSVSAHPSSYNYPPSAILAPVPTPRSECNNGEHHEAVDSEPPVDFFTDWQRFG